MTLRAGVHVNSQNIRVILWDGASVASKHKSAHRASSLTELVEATAEAVEACADGAQISDVGLALPAIIHPDDGVVLARGTIDGVAVVVAAIEPAFQGGSMGEVGGAKIAGALRDAGASGAASRLRFLSFSTKAAMSS